MQWQVSGCLEGCYAWWRLCPEKEGGNQIASGCEARMVDLRSITSFLLSLDLRIFSLDCIVSVQLRKLGPVA